MELEIKADSKTLTLTCPDCNKVIATFTSEREMYFQANWKAREHFEQVHIGQAQNVGKA